MLRLVVFDLDGTLVDSRADLAAAANELVRELGGLPLAESQVVAMVGEGVDLLVRRVVAAAGIGEPPPGATARFLEIYGTMLVDRTRPYDGIPEALAALAARVPLAVLTNKTRRESVAVLDRLNLSRFFALVYGGDGPAVNRKPHPEGLLDLASRFGAEPAETVLVGDSVFDLRTARAGRTGICLARYGFGYRLLPAGELRGDELVVDAAGDLPHVLLHGTEGGTGR